MSRTGPDFTGEAAPYLKLIGETFPYEAGKPDENGFIAVGRMGLRGSIAQRQRELAGSRERIAGDEQLLAILVKAAEIKTIKGLGVLTRPADGSLWSSLEFRTFESSSSRSDGPERLSEPINGLDATLKARGIRLSVIHMFGLSSEKSPLNPEAAVEIQQAENEAPEAMKELGMGHPGEQPFRLQYLIRFD